MYDKQEMQLKYPRGRSQRQGLKRILKIKFY